MDMHVSYPILYEELTCIYIFPSIEMKENIE